MDQQNNQEKESIDVSQMLGEKDFGAKPKSWQQPGVYVSPFAPKIVQRIIRYSGGLIKNERQAYYVLMVIVGVIFLLVIFLLSAGFRSPKVPPPELREVPAGPGDPQYVP